MSIPASCTPPSAAPATFDVSVAPDCVTALNSLYQAYVSLVSGGTRSEVRFADRTVIYTGANVAKLQELYMLLRAQCPQATVANLPNLNPGNRVRRGPPVYSVTHRQRL